MNDNTINSSIQQIMLIGLNGLTVDNYLQHHLNNSMGPYEKLFNVKSKHSDNGDLICDYFLFVVFDFGNVQQYRFFFKLK